MWLFGISQLGLHTDNQELRCRNRNDSIAKTCAQSPSKLELALRDECSGGMNPRSAREPLFKSGVACTAYKASAFREIPCRCLPLSYRGGALRRRDCAEFQTNAATS